MQTIVLMQTVKGLIAIFIFHIFRADENVNKAEKIASGDVIQKLKEDNASLQSDLVKQKQE